MALMFLKLNSDAKKEFLVSLAAVFLLLAAFLLAFSSILDDSFTFDETAHVGAGYSYLTQQDMRLNPEHPPLVKDLSALPLLFLNLNFPKTHSSWIQPENPVWWHQFDFGHEFLYHSGNNPDQILIFSRLPMILLWLFLAWFVFYWARKTWGGKEALLALFLVVFSPTFLAHARLVTTDVGAALGAVLATCFWLKFLDKPVLRNVIFAGLVFGTAMVLKFSLILLVPFFALITLVYALIHGQILKYLLLSVGVGFIGLVFIIWPVYQFHVLNYPLDRQIRDAQFLLPGTIIPAILTKFCLWLIENPVLRPLGQYLLGVFLVINRGATGNTTYFLGQVGAQGWKTYFPLVYLIKESLSFHILTLMSIVLALAAIFKKAIWQNPLPRFTESPERSRGTESPECLRGKDYLKNHFLEFSFLVFILLYWLMSVSGRLNIGVRHLLPVFPFTILLVSKAVVGWLKPPFLKPKAALLALLLLWQVFSVVKVYPHFLAYFNELAGGPNQGYLYAVDSNLDWGQDLKRLAKWVEENNVEKIYLDYFGGGDPQYFLKEKYLPWEGKRDFKELPQGSYLAVSATILQGGRAKAVKGFDQPTDYYSWLDKYQPMAKIGYSIFVYRIDY